MRGAALTRQSSCLVWSAFTLGHGRTLMMKD